MNRRSYIIFLSKYRRITDRFTNVKTVSDSNNLKLTITSQILVQVLRSIYRQRIFPDNLTPWVTLNLEVSDQRPCKKDH